MSNITNQQAFDRVALTTKKLVNALKAKDSAQNSQIQGVQASIAAGGIRVTNVEIGKVSKKLVQGADWTDIADLQSLITVGELVSILFTTSESIVGVVEKVGTADITKPLTLSGWRMDTNEDNKFGKIFYSTNGISGGVDPERLQLLINGKFTEFADNLTSNDKAAVEAAFIGSEYKGIQHLGHKAKGEIHIGNESINSTNIGNNSSGDVTIGYGSTGMTTIGSEKDITGKSKMFAGTESSSFKSIIESVPNKTLKLVFDDNSTKTLKVVE